MPISKTARLDARLPSETLEIIRHAAEIEGRSVSDFVVSSARAAAAKVIEDTRIIRLSVEDSRAFADAILDPPEPSPALRRAAKAYERLFGPTK